MKFAPLARVCPKNGPNRSRFQLVRLGAPVVLLFLVAAVFYLPSTATSLRQISRASSSKSTVTTSPVAAANNVSHFRKNAHDFSGLFAFAAPNPQVGAESIATFAADCTTAKTDFDLGETVCAKATGVPDSLFPWRISWVDPAGFIRQSDPASTDDQTTYTYTLPSSSTTVVNDQVVDNRGTWRVNLTRSNGAVRQTARFIVHEPANPQADVFTQKFQRDSNDQIHTGDNVAFVVIVGNAGPDTSLVVHLVDSVPSGATLVSFTQNSGPICTPAGAIDCEIASMANGDVAEFTAIYNLGNPPGTYQTSATASGTTPDPNTDNNTSTTEFSVQSGSGTATCDLTCPSSITTAANTTEGGQRGAHVTFADPEATGTCGSITSTPASGSFFPVGTTIVTATSETGNGSCSFSVTVEETSGSTTISCPPNKQANADSNCEAIVTLGNPTTTGENVTITVTRSDGKPMYDCDTNGENCVRKSQDLPFPAGVTTVTWTAFSHDIPGPYATPEDEEAHRTGNASCSQTVTIDDVTPPTITPPTGLTVPADANCQAEVPDFTTGTTVSDNCACSSSDTSENCQGRETLVVTQDPAPGTLVGLGQHTVSLTANDGSSNNDGAGNTSTAQITFTVIDSTAPTIHCPANITTSNDPGQCSATVNPGTATATDNCDSTPTVNGTRSDNQPLSAPYPKGTTTITWTATDDANNSSSCIQTVTVNDTENPTVSCPANITTSTDPNLCSASVNPGTATATDNCPGATVSGIRSDAQPLNAPYPKGTTTITWTATDSSGNHSPSCTQTITVNDTQPPTITCQADIIADFDPAVNGAVVTYTAPVGTDNCPGATTTQIAGLASGSTFPVGTTTNTFKVTDGVGLTATCSFKVTVAITSIIGLDSASLSGNALVDSYNSTGGYPATKGSLTNFLSNGTVSVAGSSKVFGNVRSTRVGVSVLGTSLVTGNATAGTTVTKGSSATIGGTITNNALAPVMTLPSVPACGPPYSPNSGITGTYSYNPSTGNLSLSGINIATLANGSYCFNNVTLTNSAQLKVNGPVTIKLTGTISASGASLLNNTTLIPANLRILSSYSGSNGVIFGNGNSAYLLVYAPQTNVNNTGSAPIFGTIVGKTVTISNSGALHYDTQLKTIWPEIWTLILGP